MFQFSLINEEFFRNFFCHNHIPLRDTKSISSAELDSIYNNAFRVCETFGLFISMGVLNSEKNTIETNFDSYEEAYEMYKCFVTPFHKTLGKN